MTRMPPSTAPQSALTEAATFPPPRTNEMYPQPWSRRTFLHFGAIGLTAATVRAANPPRRPPLEELVGVNTSSFARQNRATETAQRIDPFDVPRILRDEVDVRVIDLVSTMLGTRDHTTLARFRAEADRHGCVITNLKVNDRTLAFESEDAAARRHALDEYKRWIEAAAVLGVRWLRPFPAAATPPKWETLVASYRELAEHAESHGILLLIENYRWLEDQPDAIPRLVRDLPGRVAAQPDTLNWVNDDVRRRGLELAFPHAVSADFKVRELGPNDEHPAYDLRACFELGRRAGFRGPWCIEHVHADRATLLRELRHIAEMLRTWAARA
jgi:sugar phosphate isomerase/epimerase